MNTNLLLIAKVGFALLTITYLLLIIRIFKDGIKRTSWTDEKKSRVYKTMLFALVVWILMVSAWSASGMMARFEIFPMNFAPVVLIPVLTLIYLTFRSNALSDILQHIAPSRIINLQNFRVPVEILLWLLFVASMLPEQMTFEGRNLDVLTGISAPVIAWLIHRNKISRTAAIVWNFICLGLLINIVTIAVLSTPSPWRVFFEEPSNTIVTVFPISLLPGFLVPLALALHLFSLKQLFAVRSKIAGATA